MRACHYAVLIAVAGLLALPNLGAHSLWDMDEGVNAGCGREMFDAGTWVVPVFNGQLRSAKPVLLYWLHIVSFHLGGVNEWTARLPSALLGIGSVLVTYELGRRLFDASTGLLAGVALASAVQFCVLSHAATPDAPLIFFTTLTFYLAWLGHEHGGRGWLVWPAVPCGLAVLTKGPVGLAMPGLALLLYFAWNRELWRFLDRRLVNGVLLGLLVVAPWVAMVAAETKGEWVERFITNENVNRIATAQEGHAGPVFYYLAVVPLLFAPWSSVLGPVLWVAGRTARGRTPSDPRPVRFLITWMLAYLVPFSLVATKLPNYVAPLYPPLAILTAWFLVQWARGHIRPPRWVMPTAAVVVALVGVGFAAGFMVASGVTGIGGPNARVFPGLETWAWVGGIPVAAAGVMAWGLAVGRRPVVVAALAVAAVGTVGVIAAGPVLVVDRQKSAKVLTLTSGAHQPERDIRLAAVQYFQDSQSIVFYAERRVEVLTTPEQVRDFMTLPAWYLYVPEAVWQAEFAGKPGTPPCRVAARKYDVYRNAVIVVVTNESE